MKLACHTIATRINLAAIKAKKKENVNYFHNKTDLTSNNSLEMLNSFMF